MEAASNVRLTAEASKERNEILVRYSLHNGSGGEIYVLNGYVARRPDTRMPYIAPGRYSLFASGTDEATVRVGIPPLPKRKTVTRRIIPLATKLATGATLAQTLEPIHVPLAEVSPYATVEEEQAMTTMPIQRLWLAVQFISASTPGLVIETVDYDSDHVEVRPPNYETDVKEARTMLQQADTILRILPTSR